MKLSQLLAKTLRESSKEAELTSHDLLLRAGYIRQLAAGIFTNMHLGYRSLEKVKQIIREELDNIGGVELSMPFVHPATIWKQTKRWYDIDDSLVRFQDRTERDMVLAMTHEEVVAALTAAEISSYKQLPKLIYQIHDKFRDEARSRGGLIRVREFTMKDSYSLDRDYEGLEKQYQAHYNAYFRIAARLDLPVIAVLSDSGMMGGRLAHEFMYLTDVGEDTIFICEETGYQANKEVATFHKTFTEEAPKSIEKVHTPAKKTINELMEFLDMPEEQSAKMVFMTGEGYGEAGDEERLIVAVVRGDMEVNQIKLQKLCKAKTLRPATEDEIRAVGAEPGYASPIGITRDKAIVIVDELIEKTNNLLLGANEVDYHLKNVCCGRDYEPDMVGDIVSAYDGAPCVDNPDYQLKAVRGIEVGNIFQLGTKYTQALGAQFTDENGKPKPVVMGSYGIGIGRALACVVEEHHDDNGLMMPITIAPYEVMLIALNDKPDVLEVADDLYAKLQAQGLEVLYDDRPNKVATVGEKFSDADLLGMPIRLTVSKRSLKNGGVELKLRHETEAQIISAEEAVQAAQQAKAQLLAAINAKVTQVPSWKK